MNIKIIPTPLKGEVEAVSSKSVLHRALIAAALSSEPTIIEYSGLSEDIKATIGCLSALGAQIDTGERQIAVTPISKPRDCVLDCNESGSTLRFLLPLAPALNINASFTGRGRLPSRPLSPLYEELLKKGCSLTPQGVFPLAVSGKLESGDYTVAGNVSSQFITGLMLSLPLLKGDSRIFVTPPVESKPYINLTVSVLSNFGIEITEKDNVYLIKGGQKYRSPKIYKAEGDWSNAAFWLCAGALGNKITVTSLSRHSCQGDSKILDILSRMGAKVLVAGDKITAAGAPLNTADIDASDIPDLVPVISAVAAFAKGKTRIYNAERLKIKESDRLFAVSSCISALGGKILAVPGGLEIEGGNFLCGGTVDSFGDHRIAMTAAIAATRCREIVVIKNAEAVEKSYPDFFRDYKMLGGVFDVV